MFLSVGYLGFGLRRVVRYRKVVLGPFRLTLSRDGHGGGIAFREYWFVYEGPSGTVADYC